MKVKNRKGRVYAAVAGAVVGAGAIIAGAVALSDKNNQKKAQEALSSVKNRVEDYLGKVQKVTEKEKKNIKKVANKLIGSTEKVTKKAKQEVKKI